jgi:hypothetical protein
MLRKGTAVDLPKSAKEHEWIQHHHLTPVRHYELRALVPACSRVRRAPLFHTVLHI